MPVRRAPARRGDTRPSVRHLASRNLAAHTARILGQALVIGVFLGGCCEKEEVSRLEATRGMLASEVLVAGMDTTELMERMGPPDFVTPWEWHLYACDAEQEHPGGVWFAVATNCQGRIEARAYVTRRDEARYGLIVGDSMLHRRGGLTVEDCWRKLPRAQGWPGIADVEKGLGAAESVVDGGEWLLVLKRSWGVGDTGLIADVLGEIVTYLRVGECRKL